MNNSHTEQPGVLMNETSEVLDCVRCGVASALVIVTTTVAAAARCVSRVALRSGMRTGHTVEVQWKYSRIVFIHALSRSSDAPGLRFGRQVLN